MSFRPDENFPATAKARDTRSSAFGIAVLLTNRSTLFLMISAIDLPEAVESRFRLFIWPSVN
jgi:hypothetical protein